MKSAVLYCVFNRLDTVEKTFAAIKAAKPPRLYINSDGPRPDKQGEAQMVEKVRKYILDNIDWDCEVKTNFHKTNIGMNKSMIGGISWFFDNEEMGIIVEEDILCGQQFFEYCDILLEKYKDNEKVRTISGSCLDVESEYDNIFHPLSLIWGWASWRRVWKTIDFDIDKLSKKINYKYLESVMHDKIFAQYYDYIFTLYSNLATFTWSWDYIFLINNLLAAKDGYYSLNLTNKKKLITNIGYEGVHYNKNNAGTLGWPISEIDIDNLKCPKSVELDLQSIKKYAKECEEELAKIYSPKAESESRKKAIASFITAVLGYIKMSLAQGGETRKRRYLRYNEKKHNFYDSKYEYDKIMLAKKICKSLKV